MRSRSDLCGSRIWHVVLASVCVLVVAPQGILAQGGPSPERAIRLMDTDGDGKISADEWLRPPRAFRRIDRNRDGYLTIDEMKSFMGNRPGDAQAEGANDGLKSRPAVDIKSTPNSASYEIIHTHVHFGASANQRDFVAGASEALTKLPLRHIVTAIVLPTPQVSFDYDAGRYDYLELRSVSRDERFKVGGGPGMFGKWLHNKATISDVEKAEFRSLAEMMVTDGIVVFGEIGLNHFGIPGLGNRYGRIPLDHPLLKVLGEVSASTGVPIDIHFDVVPQDKKIPRALKGAGNPSFLKSNLSQFEKFLSENRGAKIVWAHAGFEPSPFRTAELNADLLRRHANLFMSIRLMRGAPKPSAAMDENGQLKSEWRQLFVEFSDRFVLGSESMYGSTLSGMFDTQFMLYQRLLSELPATVARKIASENARLIYPLQ